MPASLEIAALLAQLESRGVKLSLDGGDVRFRAPLGVLSADERSALQNQRQFIRHHLSARQAALKLKLAETRPGEQRPSYSQELWWRAYGGCDEGRPFAINIPIVTLMENTDCGHVTATIKSLLFENEALRSRFVNDHGRLRLELNSVEDFHAELSRPPSNSYIDNLEAARRTLPEFFSQLLPIEGQWLMKARVFSLGGGTFLVAIALNHIICDGTSRAIIIARLQSSPSESIGLSSQASFLSYSTYERDVIDSDHGQHLQKYWEDWSESAPKIFSPKNHYPMRWRPGTRKRYRFSLSHSVFRRVQDMARTNGTTPFVIYLTVYAISMAEWCGYEAFSIRGLGDRRLTPELSNVVGLMYCADAFRIQVSREDCFEENLRRVHSSYQESLGMRLPTIQIFPPHLAKPKGGNLFQISNDVPAAINYFLGPSLTSSSNHDQHLAKWPPPIVIEKPQLWTRPISPIFLQLCESHSEVVGQLQFNEALLSVDEQRRFIAIYFQVFAKNELVE